MDKKLDELLAKQRAELQALLETQRTKREAAVAEIRAASTRTRAPKSEVDERLTIAAYRFGRSLGERWKKRSQG
jgi:hypothetical protein